MPTASLVRPVCPHRSAILLVVLVMFCVAQAMAVDADSFAPVSAMMQTWAAAFQLDYDGWECAVVTH